MLMISMPPALSGPPRLDLSSFHGAAVRHQHVRDAIAEAPSWPPSAWPGPRGRCAGGRGRRRHAAERDRVGGSRGRAGPVPGLGRGLAARRHRAGADPAVRRRPWSSAASADRATGRGVSGSSKSPGVKVREWLYQYRRLVRATRRPWARPPTPAEAPAKQARRPGLDVARLPRCARPVRRRRRRGPAVPAAPAERRAAGDPVLRRAGRRFRRNGPEQRLFADLRLRSRRRVAPAAAGAGPERWTDRGRPADHRNRRGARRPAVPLADRRHPVRGLRLPHDPAGREREPARGCGGGLWGYASQPFHSTRGAGATRSEPPAWTRTAQPTTAARRGTGPAVRPIDPLGDVEYRLLAPSTRSQRLEDDSPTGTRKDFAADSPSRSTSRCWRSKRTWCRSAPPSRPSARGRRPTG